MKKIISTLLILAMVLTMALSVSAAASIATLFTGNYIAYVPMPGGNMPMYEVSFTPSNASQGTFDIVDNYTTQYTGTYSYSVDYTDTVTVMAGTDDISSMLNFTQDNGELTLVIRGTPYPLTASAGGGSQGPTGTELTIGNNTIPVAISSQGSIDYVQAYFTASEAGTYIISAAAGEANADVAVEDQYGSSSVTLPYEVTLAAGETFECIISTTLNPIQNLGTTDNIDLVLTKKVDTPAGGGNAGGGSANTGDSVALYVALGAVALASILGCAIVSKKRIAE